MQKEINKYLTEATGAANRDFTTWNGFGILWEWVIEQEWWNKFLWTGTLLGASLGSKIIDANLINPEKFANAIYRFLKEKHEKE